jgi:hypothetical protein
LAPEDPEWGFMGLIVFALGRLFDAGVSFSGLERKVDIVDIVDTVDSKCMTSTASAVAGL